MGLGLGGPGSGPGSGSGSGSGSGTQGRVGGTCAIGSCFVVWVTVCSREAATRGLLPNKRTPVRALPRQTPRGRQVLARPARRRQRARHACLLVLLCLSRTFTTTTTRRHRVCEQSCWRSIRRTASAGSWQDASETSAPPCVVMPAMCDASSSSSPSLSPNPSPTPSPSLIPSSSLSPSLSPSLSLSLSPSPNHNPKPSPRPNSILTLS